MPVQSFDLIVIGTGSAGSTVAQTVREAGKTVAIIDKLPFGGTCSQRGCDPKKVLVGAAEIIGRADQMIGKGISAQPTIIWSDLMAFKKTFTDPVPDRTDKKFDDLGIQSFHGTATFTSPNSLRVGKNELQAERIVIAAGAKPRSLGIPGEELLIDSTGFLELEKLPANLVLVGGGYIAFEFAHIAARAGASVTIIHKGKRPLEGFDADVVKLLVNAMKEIGITIVLDADVTAISGEPGELTVQYQRKGKEKTVSAAVVVHAAGRVADVDELDLKAAGVTIGEKGITVDEYLRSTSNPAIYACGDVADKGLPLTPVAGYEGGIVARNILSNNGETISDALVPSTVFTVPPLASVGMTEEQANQSGKKLIVTTNETAEWYSSRRIQEPSTGFKTIVDADSGQILGAHLLGSGSEEVINLFTLAIKYSIPAKELRSTLFAYPTHSSDLSYMLPSE